MNESIDTFLSLPADQRDKNAWWQLASFYLDALKMQTGYAADIGRFQIFEDITFDEFVGQIHVPMPLKDAGGDYWEGIFSISYDKSSATTGSVALRSEIFAFPYSAEGDFIGAVEDIDYFLISFQDTRWQEAGRISPEFPGEWDGFIEGAYLTNLEASPKNPVFKKNEDVTILLNLTSNDYLSEYVQQWQALLIELSCNTEMLVASAEGEMMRTYPANEFNSLLRTPGKHASLKLNSFQSSNRWQPGSYSCRLRMDYTSKDGLNKTYTSEICEPFSFQITS